MCDENPVNYFPTPHDTNLERFIIIERQRIALRITILCELLLQRFQKRIQGHVSWINIHFRTNAGSKKRIVYEIYYYTSRACTLGSECLYNARIIPLTPFITEYLFTGYNIFFHLDTFFFSLMKLFFFFSLCNTVLFFIILGLYI